VREAIELAAARIKLLSPEEIVGRLGRALTLLKSKAADLPTKHQILRATIEWSYKDLGRVLRNHIVFGPEKALGVPAENKNRCSCRAGDRYP